MPTQTFRHDDAGYEAWLADHPTGWVVDARRSPSAAYVKLHRAACATISRRQAGCSRWTTGEYVKVCAERRDELETWAERTFRAELQDGCHCVQDGGHARTSTARRPPVSRLPAATAPFALASNEGERLVFGDVTVLIKASCETTGGAFTIFEEGPPLLDTPRHVHANEDEVFHVLEGEHVVECGDAEFCLGPGGLTPGGFEGFFRTLADADRAGALGPHAYAAASEQYGITWLS